MNFKNKFEQVNRNAHYWVKRKENAQYAKEWTDKMAREYEDEILTCAKEWTRPYSNTVDVEIEKTPWHNHKPHIPEIILEKTDSVSAVIKYDNLFDNVCVLNFASHKEPGGRFLDGSIAQEECLCKESYLYNVLSLIDKHTNYYKENRKNLNRALYTNRALFTRGIRFFKNGVSSARCSVLTCAAPNFAAAHTYQHVTKEENLEVLKSRIKFVLDIMAANHVDIPILGAFGCGVFGQDAKEVASIFATLLGSYNYPFTKVVFAVIPGPNADDFEEVLKGVM